MMLRVGSLSVEFSMWNPLYAFAPFLILFASIPLSICAVITTTFAVALLSLRALVVYLQLGVVLIYAWLVPPRPKSSARIPPQSTRSSKRSSPTRQRHRRSSNVSSTSQDTVVASMRTPRLHKKIDSFSALIGISEGTRDFEGVGGWRLPGDSDEEALWMGLNSRLQLPADPPVRRHKRSLTGGASPNQRWSWNPEALRMSPVQSRARTPMRYSTNTTEDYSYFPPQSMANMQPMSATSDPPKHHVRRKSGSASSTSSTTSASGLTMAIREHGK